MPAGGGHCRVALGVCDGWGPHTVRGGAPFPVTLAGASRLSSKVPSFQPRPSRRLHDEMVISWPGVSSGPEPGHGQVAWPHAVGDAPVSSFGCVPTCLSAFCKHRVSFRVEKTEFHALLMARAA